MRSLPTLFAARRTLVLLAMALTVLLAVSCGDGKRTGRQVRGVSRSTSNAVSGTRHEEPDTGTSAAPAQQRRAAVFTLNATTDYDLDGTLSARGLDPDDDYIERTGLAAGSADRAAITALVNHYFDALAHEDYSRACSLMFLGLENLVAETYSQTSPSQTAGAGMTCAAVLSRLFDGHHGELAEESRRLDVVAVRVNGFSALAVLRFAPKAVRRIALYREQRAWKIGAVQAAKLR